jgi:hypothetical protein
MISIKAISALTLTGLGAATMSTDVYLANQKPAPPPYSVVIETRHGSPPATVPIGERAPTEAPPLELDPVVITGRLHKAVPQAPKRELTVCSDWHSLASGPAARGVRALCVPGTLAIDSR